MGKRKHHDSEERINRKIRRLERKKAKIRSKMTDSSEFSSRHSSRSRLLRSDDSQGCYERAYIREEDEIISVRENISDAVVVPEATSNQGN